VIGPTQRPPPDNTHDRHPCPSVGFEPTFSAGERPQTYALDRTATVTVGKAMYRGEKLPQ